MKILRLRAFAILTVSLLFTVFLLFSGSAIALPIQAPSNNPGPGTQSMPEVSAEAIEQAEEIASHYIDTQVTRQTDDKVRVTFKDATTGKEYAYTFDKNDNVELLEAPDGTPHTRYQSEGHWWGVKYRLNRNETRNLANEGSTYSLLYSIGTLAGCQACAIGAAIEGNWAVQANTLYNRGSCIHLNMPYGTTGETRINTYNCKN
ncbi:MAG TPA: hypothetical protein V6C65_36420 [Allocoleopsis sp.]